MVAFFPLAPPFPTFSSPHSKCCPPRPWELVMGQFYLHLLFSSPVFLPQCWSWFVSLSHMFAGEVLDFCERRFSFLPSPSASLLAQFLHFDSASPWSHNYQIFSSCFSTSCSVTVSFSQSRITFPFINTLANFMAPSRLSSCSPSFPSQTIMSSPVASPPSRSPSQTRFFYPFSPLFSPFVLNHWHKRYVPHSTQVTF